MKVAHFIFTKSLAEMQSFWTSERGNWNQGLYEKIIDHRKRGYINGEEPVFDNDLPSTMYNKKGF